MSDPTLILRTRDRAELDRLAIRPDAELLGELRPEEAPATQINFETIAMARLFVSELALADVRVLAASHEDAAAILAQVQHEPGATIH